MTDLLPASSSKENRFDWPLCYEAESFVLAQLNDFQQRNTFADQLAQRMRDETGTLLLDWVDYLVLSSRAEEALRAVGYREDRLGETPSHQTAFWHPEAMLPRVILDGRVEVGEFPSAVAIHTESVSDFMAAQATAGPIEGTLLSRFRRCIVSLGQGARLDAVERRGYRGYVPITAKTSPTEPSRRTPSNGELDALLEAHELWKVRRRIFDDDQKGYHELHALLDRVVGLVGRDLACHVVFAEERAFWQRRNRAAQIQKARQDRLGLGWANHDHHTFRSSRRHFLDLMLALQKLGFERRERYYAGAQAGWGAQILEQPVEGIVAFCDLDLQPEETEIDFSRLPLPPAARLGTIGLWVGLHGESLLDAGMHHLECRFDYQLLREQLAGVAVSTMKPFSDLPFLRQAFTEGENWRVRRERAEALLRSGRIDQQQFDQFLTQGAIGSHLENLQRKGGFKGFNQKSVSAIIQATDPRKQGVGVMLDA